MKKYITAIYVLLGIVLLGACSEEDFTTFDGTKSGIYMQRVATTDITGTPLSYSDSMTVTFANYESDTERLRTYVPVKIMGNVKDYDRRFKLVVNPELSNAVEGMDYELSDTACYIPAGETSRNVFFYIKKTDKLSSQSVKIVFELQDNENFTVELDKYKNTVSWSSTGSQLCGSHYKLIFNNIWEIPYQWSFWGDWYLGTWSVKKETLLNKLMGWEHYEFDSKASYGIMPYLAKKLQKYLQEQADAGTPVVDEDGSYMQLVDPYLVNYSQYTDK